MKSRNLGNTGKTNSTVKKMYINKTRFLIITLFVLIAVSSTAIFSATTSASSLDKFFENNLPAPIASSLSSISQTVFGIMTVNNASTVTEATISTDKADYFSGESVIIRGQGFQPNENITLQISDTIHNAHEPWTIRTDNEGNFASSWDISFDHTKDQSVITFFLSATGDSGAMAQTTFTDPSGDALLGAWNTKTTPQAWQSSTMNGGDHDYNEGEVVPYRLVLTNALTNAVQGSNWTVKLKYDFENINTGRRFVDSLGTYNATVNANGCTSTITCDGPPSEFAIPGDTSVLPAQRWYSGGSPGKFFVYNGSITAVSSYTTVDGSGIRRKELTISGTTAASTVSTTKNVIILFGAHLARENEWGVGKGASSFPGASAQIGFDATFTKLKNGNSQTIDDSNNLALNPGGIVKQSDLSIVKSGAASVTAGSNLTYTLTVTNNGPNQATAANVSDTLPANTTLVSAVPSQGTCSGTSTVSCGLGIIDATQTATINITVQTATSNTGYSISNKATVSGSPIDPNTTNNESSTVTTTVNPNIASTTTSISAPTITYGSNGIVTVTVASASNTPSGSVSLSVDGGAPTTQPLSNGSSIFTINKPNAGTYSLSANYAAQGNFGASSTTGSLQVERKPATVTPAANSKSYGSADPTLSGALTDFLAGDNVTATYSRVAGETVAGGPYTISATLSPAGVLGNYNITYNTAAFTISQKAASVTPNAASKSYGDGDPAVSSTLTGFLAGDNVTASYSRTAGETVAGSPYTISATLSPAGVLGNYNITYNTAAFTINQKAASVTPNDASKSYGDGNPALSGTLNGFLSGDGVTASYSRTAGETVAGGPYTISATLSPAGVLGNYNITYNTAAFTINQKAASVTPNAASKTYGYANPALSGTLSGFVAGDNVTATYSRVAGETVAGGPYTISATLSPAGVLGNYNITYNTANFTINPADQTINFGALSNKYIGNGGITVGATGGGSGNAVTFSASGACTNSDGGTAILFVGIGTCTVTASQAGNSNYNAATIVSQSFTVNADPTTITLDNKISGINFDCSNTYTATVTDTITNAVLSGVPLKLTIGTQTATATTNNNGVATFTLTLNQATGSVTESVVFNGTSWTDPIRVQPAAASRSFTVNPSPNVGPALNGTSLYTGSLFFWTTSSTSSTATLTLSATIRDTGICLNDPSITGDITKAKVSFQISTNGGGSFSPVSSAQNLPVGLVNPTDTSVGTASAISQYNIGNDQSVTLMVRVVVTGQYNLNSTTYDQLVTIGKPGTARSLMGGGKVTNDNNPFPANGYLGLNSIESSFGSQVKYNNSGTNPQGQVTVTIRSCNKANGLVDPNCVPSDALTHHVYFIKSNSISELTTINGAATFGSKTNVSEVLADGTKIGLDGGGTMQIVFTPFNTQIPTGMFIPAGTSFSSTSGKCTNQQGCMSVTAYRSSGIGGGVWYSSAWGQVGTSAPRTYVKNVLSGDIAVVQ